MAASVLGGQHDKSAARDSALRPATNRDLTNEIAGGPADRRSASDPCASETVLCNRKVTHMNRPGFESSSSPERLSADGVVWITLTQLAFLNALLDRPDSTARSYRDWYRAALPYVRSRSHPRLLGLTLRGDYAVPAKWVKRTKVGSRVEIRLTARGHEILDRKVVCRIWGLGVYRGLRALGIV